MVGRHFRPDVGVVCDAPSFLARLLAAGKEATAPNRKNWIDRLGRLRAEIMVWTR